MSETLFMEGNVGPLLKVGKAAERLAEPGFSVKHAAGQLRGLTARGLVRASGRVGEGRVIHNLFGLHDLAVAKILSILTVDASTADPVILEQVARQLYSWPDHPEAARDDRYPSTIRAALGGAARGDYWACRIDLRRDQQTGDKIVNTMLYDTDQGPRRVAPPGSSFPPNLSFVIPLYLPFKRILGAPDGRMSIARTSGASRTAASQA